MKRRSLSKAQRAALLAEYADPTIRVVDIAKKFGVGSGYVSRLAHRAGAEPRNPRGGGGTSLREEIFKMARGGMSAKDIRAAMKDRASPMTLNAYLSHCRTMGGIVASETLGQFASRGLKQALELEAEQRGISLHDLVDRLLSAIVEDELFDAVLDDRKGGA